MGIIQRLKGEPDWSKEADKLETIEKKGNKPSPMNDLIMHGAPSKPRNTAIITGPLPGDIKQYNGVEMANPNQTGKAVWKDWSMEAAAREGYKSATWVYACIDRLGRAVGSARLQAERRQGDTWVHEPASQLQGVLDRPNEDTSTRSFLFQAVLSLSLSGNALFSEVAMGKKLLALYGIQPYYTEPIAGKEGEAFIKEYVFKNGANRKVFPSETVMHLKYDDPLNLYWGMSPIQAMARTLDTDNEAVDYNKVALQNRAVTDGVFTFKNRMNQDQWDTARSRVREQHQGSKNARAPWVLDNEASWQQMSISPLEMDFLNSRKFNLEEICAGMSVPPPIIGIYENATLANIQTARLIFWEDTVIPLLDFIVQAMTWTVGKYYGPGWRVSYDVSHVSVLLEITKKKQLIAKDMFSMGVPMKQINDILKLGLEPYTGWETGYLPSTLVPNGSAGIDTFLDEE